MKKIVITGTGIISSIGNTSEEVFNNVMAANTNIKQETYFIDNKNKFEYFLHKVERFDLNNFKIDKYKLLELENWKKVKVNKDLLYSIAAAKSALLESGIDSNAYNDDVGVVSTCEGPGLEEFFDFIVNLSLENSLKSTKRKFDKKEFILNFYNDCEHQAYDLQTFMHLFFISKMLNVHGFSLFINNACSSGLYALETAAQIIRTNKCNKVLVVGGDSPSFFKYLWFNNKNLYANDGLIKPFSKKSNGYVFGEGAAAIVLESLDSAKSRKANILAEYIGASFLTQSWKVAYPSFEQNCFEKTMINNLKDSKIKSSQIDLVCGHGVGVKITDSYELKAFRNVFNNSKAVFTALKPYFGHNLGGSSIMELVMLLKVLKNNAVPKILNLEGGDFMEKLNFVLENLSKKIKYIMKTSTGFAGYDASLIIKKYEN